MAQLGALSSAKLQCSSGTKALYKICAGEQDVEPVHVFGYPTVYNLGVTELSPGNQERMLDLTSGGGLPVLDLFVQVDSFVAGRNPEAGRPDICSEFNFTEVLIVLNLRTLFGSAVTGITLADFIVFPQQMGVLFIRCCTDGPEPLLDGTDVHLGSALGAVHKTAAKIVGTSSGLFPCKTKPGVDERQVL